MINVVTIYDAVLLAKEMASDDVIKMGPYTSVQVIRDGVVLETFGNTAQKGEEMANAFVKGITYVLNHTKALPELVMWRSAILRNI